MRQHFCANIFPFERQHFSFDISSLLKNHATQSQSVCLNSVLSVHHGIKIFLRKRRLWKRKLEVRKKFYIKFKAYSTVAVLWFLLDGLKRARPACVRLLTYTCVAVLRLECVNCTSGQHNFNCKGTLTALFLCFKLTVVSYILHFQFINLLSLHQFISFV